jgi:hypothetical protein
MLSGDVDTGKTILRDYIKSIVGFEKLGAATGVPQKPDPHVRPASNWQLYGATVACRHANTRRSTQPSRPRKA